LADPLHQAIAQIIRRHDADFDLVDCRAVGGGSINSALRFRGRERSYFVKLNAASAVAMFEAEAQGLQELAGSAAVRVPEVICYGVIEARSYLICEWLELGAAGQRSAGMLGRQLADMHRHTRPVFGWLRDNTIGSTPQCNLESADWIAFWREQRLGFQLKLGARNGFPSSLLDKGERLVTRLDKLLDGHRPAASLLHGDLWGGNWGALADGSPVLFDPAVYYGDREADIAMTELFGGFPDAFYVAYRESWPLDEGYAMRRTLYNLYHILNHANLFGGGYASQASGMIEHLLAEAG